MNLGSIQLIFFAIIRFEAMKTFIGNNKNLNQSVLKELRIRNRRSLITGLCMAFGLGVAANFHDSEGVLVQTVHAFGAYFLFLSSVFEVWFQSRTDFLINNRRTGIFRTFQAVMSLFLVITFLPCNSLSFDLYPTAHIDLNARLKWDSSRDGYWFHLMSSLNEWLLVFNLSVYYFSFDFVK